MAIFLIRKIQKKFEQEMIRLDPDLIHAKMRKLKYVISMHRNLIGLP